MHTSQIVALPYDRFAYAPDSQTCSRRFTQVWVRVYIRLTLQRPLPLTDVGTHRKAFPMPDDHTVIEPEMVTNQESKSEQAPLRTYA